MSFMFEVYCGLPEDAERDARILAEVLADGGHLDYRESSTYICLTYDFPTEEQAEGAAQRVKQLGLHVEGPVDYGD